MCGNRDVFTPPKSSVMEFSPSLRPPERDLIESRASPTGSFGDEKKKTFLSIKLLLLGIPEWCGDPWGCWERWNRRGRGTMENPRAGPQASQKKQGPGTDSLLASLPSSSHIPWMGKGPGGGQDGICGIFGMGGVTGTGSSMDGSLVGLPTEKRVLAGHRGLGTS